MGAPMGSFRNYGHETRAIAIIDRSLAEEEPGVYRGRVKIPVEGEYDIAFLMDTPQFLHCFSAVVEPDPNARAAAGVNVEFQIDNRFVTALKPHVVRFVLSDAGNQSPIGGLEDVTVLYYRADGRGRQVVSAKSVGDGVYEATLQIGAPTTYYVFVAAPSRKLDYTDMSFLSLIAQPDKGQ